VGLTQSATTAAFSCCDAISKPVDQLDRYRLATDGASSCADGLHCDERKVKLLVGEENEIRVEREEDRLERPPVGAICFRLRCVRAAGSVQGKGSERTHART
jgi:hypothetical protein